MKDDINNLENRMTEAIKRSQLAFDARLTSIATDTNRILNRTCKIDDKSPLAPQSFINTNKLFSLDDDPIQNPVYSFGSASPEPFSSASLRNFHNGNRPREPRARDEISLEDTNTAAQVNKLNYAIEWITRLCTSFRIMLNDKRDWLKGDQGR